MIIKFKLFENNQEPQVGDYVIIDTYMDSQIIKNWLLNNIGEIIDIEKKITTKNLYVIKYKNVPNEWKYYFSYGYIKDIIKISKFDIKYFSQNKEDLEVILNTNKYNL